MPFYVPSLKVRKEQSGHPCPGCSLIMHHKDMIAWSGQIDTIYMHAPCAELLLDMGPHDVIHYDGSPGDDEPPPEEEAEGGSERML